MLLLSMLLACSSSYTLEADLANGLGGDPIGGYKVVAKADDRSITLSCQTAEGEVDANGHLTLAGLCPGTTYTLEHKADVAVPDLLSVPDGGFGGPKSAKIFPAPQGEGAYVLTGLDVKSVSSNADQKKDTPLGATEPVYYPGTTPGKFPVVEPGSYLVLAGESTQHQIVPLVPNARVEVEGGQPLAPWYYAGVRFEGNTPTKAEATPDAAKVTEVTVGERTVRFLAADALPAGRYVLYTPGQRRMTLFDMGGPAELALPEAGEADAGKGAKGKKKR